MGRRRDFNISKDFLKKTDISGEIKQSPKISDAVRADAENQLRPIFDAVQRDLRKLKALKSVRSNIYALGLLGNISKNVEQFRAENEIILLSDTNDLLKRIITEDDAPFIYERIGMMLSNYLIDEFQDTSRMQWENLHPLLSESLSRGNGNLIIGDEKQSIYRFRNAEPEVGALYYGEVKRVISNLGAFVELVPGKDAMCHIKDLEFKRTEKVEDVLNVGDKTWVKFTGIDEKGRWNISRKDALRERGEA